MNLRSLIMEPELLDMDVEDAERIKRHVKIIAKKPMLRGVFKEFYDKCISLDIRYFGDTKGKRVELGAGVSMFKTFYPEIMVTDIKPADHLDAIVDAQAMPFEDSSIRTLYGLSFFHHLPDPDLFFKEALRVLSPGGGFILLDPYYGPVASQFYKWLHATEIYDKSDPHWGSITRGAMRNANQALSYIVFQRDRKRFNTLFPDLEIVYEKPESNYLRYFFSGGLNYRSLLPNFFIGPLKLLEKALTPILPWTALYQMIVIRKRHP